MIQRIDVINELINRGINAVAKDVVRNGVTVEAIVIMKDINMIYPVIYTEQILMAANKVDADINEVVDNIITFYEKHKELEFDVNNLCDRQFVLDHIYIGVQMESCEELLKGQCDFDGIESYLYLRIPEDNGSFSCIKLKNEILQASEVSLNDAWRRAEGNTFAETVIDDIDSLLQLLQESHEMTDDNTKELMDETPLYILRNKVNFKGASAILDKNALRKFASEIKTDKIVAIPSSIHEWILIPYGVSRSLPEINKIINEVNGEALDPSEILGNKAYVLSFKKNE